MTQPFTISGPFNIQHIPKVRDISPATPFPLSKDKNGDLKYENNDVNNIKKNSSTSSGEFNNTNNFPVNSLVVCTYPFTAEYKNELSCSSGEVFKLVDSKVINGWILVHSLSSGLKGWVPKDNVKILDLKNEKSNSIVESFIPSRSVTPISTTKSSIHSTNVNSPTLNSSNSLDSTDSLLDFYSSSMTTTLSNKSLISNSLPFFSIFVHSMHSLENSQTTFWYRIDLESNTEKIHIARYYKDILQLQNSLNSAINQSKNIHLKLPKLPSYFNGIYSNDKFVDTFLMHLSDINQYLQNVFNIINTQSPDSLIYVIFLKFCKTENNDFQHYVKLDDDQILKILKPCINSSNLIDDVELDIGLNKELSIIDSNDYYSLSAPKLHKSISMLSFDSKTSSNSTIRSISDKRSTDVKVKIFYKDDCSLIKISKSKLSFKSLHNAISEKLDGLSTFTLAYRNNQGILILLRNDTGLQKALLLNDKKIIIKVI
jgi:uncharacterized lipoprotein YehR (DUF1307 family)